MRQLIEKLCIFVLVFAGMLALPVTTHAAVIRQGDTVTIGENEQNLQNVYLFGDKLTVNAPITDDLVTAGGTITTDSNVTGNVMAAGGNISLKGLIGKSARVAGGNITIDSKITQDLVIGGGNIRISKNASIGGDLIVAGGTVQVDGPVAGNIYFSGGKVTVNNTVGRDMRGTVGTLTLGSQAHVNGDLTYSSDEKAHIANGANVIGQTKFQQTQKHNERAASVQNSVTTVGVYKLVIDIILSVLFIYFFTRFASSTVQQMTVSPWKNIGTGFTFFFLFPLAAVIGLILIWLGIAGFLFYALVLLIALFLVKVFLGWFVMRWWEKRSKHTYALDWKAGVIGPIILFALAFIPILGWLTLFVLFLMAVGALTQEFLSLVQSQKLEHKTTKKK
jgi:hypothetical protein